MNGMGPNSSVLRHVMLYGLLITFIAIHVLSFVLLLNWNNTASLFGTRNWLLNRFYSTKTLHSHIVNTLDGNKLVHADNSHDKPAYWNSLGVVTAYEGEVIEQNYVTTLPFLNQSQNSQTVCNVQKTSKCMFEHVPPELLYVNGDSISILSEISPSLYLGTLLVIYLLSSVSVPISPIM